MLRYVNYDIVFQEIPDEVTLAINISHCPYRCLGCHSPHLREDIGTLLTEDELTLLIEKYKNAITCICFMGGNSEPEEIEQLSGFILSQYNANYKTAWYSGSDTLPKASMINVLDYIKVGSYNQNLGGLSSENTNQRFYKKEKHELIDITYVFK